MSRRARGTEIDPITIEVIHNGLRSVSDESYIALMKSAYSTNIKERHDHSTCLMDAHGRIIVQATQTQSVHLSSMLGHVQAVLANHGVSDIREGDIFISNDPYVAGGSHLPDVNFAMPVFIGDELVAFSCNIAHHADIGGMAPGSMSSNMTEIYQEGLRIPVIRLFAGGSLVNDVLSLILLNVRLPEERRGDYFAQVASCRLAERRLQELFATHGLDRVGRVFDEIIQRTELRLRRAIASIPDGVYRFEDVMDDDGNGTFRIPIRLAITVAGERIGFDFTGTSPQVLGNINCPFTATQSAVCYTMKALLDPDAANNQGILNVMEIAAEQGSLLNPVFPAAVAYRSHTTQRVVDVVMGAMAAALPERVLGASNGSNTTAIFSGVDPRNRNPYLYLETLGGGCGGRARRDGKDGVQQHIANTANLPVEAIESEYPLRVREYSLAPDTGGAGRHRGGLALRRIIQPIGHDCIFTGAGERFAIRPWGVFGGTPGATGRFTLTSSDGTRKDLGGKPTPMPCRAGERIEIQSPGAGGYGSPAARDIRRLAIDWHSGKFSASYMMENYGLNAEAAAALPYEGIEPDYDDA